MSQQIEDVINDVREAVVCIDRIPFNGTASIVYEADGSITLSVQDGEVGLEMTFMHDRIITVCLGG